MFNPALFAPLVRAQLDGILNGNAPDGFTITETSEKRIVLTPKDTEGFDGVEVVSVNLTIRYKGIDISLIA